MESLSSVKGEDYNKYPGEQNGILAPPMKRAGSQSEQALDTIQ